MKPYNLEVGWSADELAAACEALKACRQINPENPIAAAQAISELWRLINDAHPAIEDEAERREQAFFGQIEPYWREMRELVNRIEALISKATARE